MKRQMVVRLEGRDFSAVSNAADLITAKTECTAQLQQLIFNNLGIMPTVRTLITHMRYFKPI